MYKSVSAPLLNFDEPSFQEDPQESWDGSYATANVPFSLKLSKSNNQERRRSFEQDSDAFEHVLDTAMKRTAARQKARDREAEFLSNPHEKLKSLPRTKRELYATVQNFELSDLKMKIELMISIAQWYCTVPRQDDKRYELQS